MLQKIKAWLLKEYLEDLTYIDNRLIEFHDRLKSIESGVSKFGMKIAEDMKSFIKNSENTISKETNTFLSGVKEKL